MISSGPASLTTGRRPEPGGVAQRWHGRAEPRHADAAVVRRRSMGHHAAVDRMFLHDLPGIDNAEPFALANFIFAYVGLDARAGEPVETFCS